MFTTNKDKGVWIVNGWLPGDERYFSNYISAKRYLKEKLKEVGNVFLSYYDKDYQLWKNKKNENLVEMIHLI